MFNTNQSAVLFCLLMFGMCVWLVSRCRAFDSFDLKNHPHHEDDNRYLPPEEGDDDDDDEPDVDPGSLVFIHTSEKADEPELELVVLRPKTVVKSLGDILDKTDDYESLKSQVEKYKKFLTRLV